jgi:hypothetical protein
MRSRHRGLFLAAIAALLLAGCTVRTSTLPLLPSATPSESAVAANPTPTPSDGLTIPVDAPQPTAHIPPWQYVSAADVTTTSASRTSKIYFCIGPSLAEPIGTKIRVQVLNSRHEVAYSYTAPLPYARAITLVPGQYSASIADVAADGSVDGGTVNARTNARLPAGQSIYLMSGNSCPRGAPL